VSLLSTGTFQAGHSKFTIRLTADLVTVLLHIGTL
jgi:hypothetical protein